jgi:hypothetical protein
MMDGLFGEAFLPVNALASIPNAVHATRLLAIRPHALYGVLASTPRQMPAWPMRVS